MSLSLFPPSRNGSNLNLRRGYVARRSRGERAIMLAAIELLEPRQLLAGTPAPTTPAVSFNNAEVLSLANAVNATNGTPEADDRPFPDGLFLVDMTGFDETHGGTSKPLDIVFLGHDGLTIMAGNGNGTFKTPEVYPVAPLADSGSIYEAIYGGSQMPHGFLDLNGDGIPDFVVVESTASDAGPNQTPGSVTVFLGNSNGTFKTEDYSNDVGVNPAALTVADLHITGVKNEEDIALANIGNRTVTILTGNGKGQFGTNGVLAANEPAPLSVGNAPDTIVASDVNGDGVPDLIVGNDNSFDPTISVLVNKSANKGASFEPQFVFNYGGGVELAKINSSTPFIVTSDADILTPNVPLANPNVPTFTVTPSIGAASYAASSINPTQAFNSTQFPGRSKYQDDVVETSYRYSTVTIARGDGTLGFYASDQTYSTVTEYTPVAANSTANAPAPYLLGYAPLSAATGDVNGDGFPDIVTGDYGVRGGDNGYDVDITRPPAITIFDGSANGSFSGEKQPGIEVGETGADVDGGTNPTGQTVNDYGPGAVDQDGYPAAGPVTGTNPYPNEIAIADLNGDGLNDIVTVGSGSAPTAPSPVTTSHNGFKLSNLPGVVTALLNNADGVAGSFGAAPESIGYSGTLAFIGVSSFADFYQPVGVAVGDVNGDGVPDLIVLNKVVNHYSNSSTGGTQFGVTDASSTYISATGGRLSFTITDTQFPNGQTTGSFPFDAGPALIQQAFAGFAGVSVNGTFLDELTGITVSFASSEGAATLTANTGALTPSAAVVTVTPVTTGTYYTGDIVVYQGLGDGLFNPTPLSTTDVGFNPLAMELIPVGGDGLDLVVVNYGVPYKDKTHFGAAGSIQVLTDNTNGTFTVQQSFADPYGPSAVAVGTFGNTVNNTAVEDFAVTNRLDSLHEEGVSDPDFKESEEEGDLQIYLGDGQGNFTQSYTTIPVGIQPNAIVTGNFNGPNAPLGLAVLNEKEESLTLLRGNGDGTFITQQIFDFPYLPDANLGTNPTPRETDSAPVSIAAGDINGDGYTDIVVTYAGTNSHPGYSDTNPGGKVGVMLNLGAASPDGLGDLAAPVQEVTADTQIDEEPFKTEVTYKATASIPDNVAVADMNGDGKNDLVILNGNQGKYTGTVNVLLNNSKVVNSKPGFNVSTVTFAVGTTGTQTVTATGFPVPTLSDGLSLLPPGLTITFSPTNGTATISGRPTIVGDTTISLTATNSVGSTTEILSIDVVPGNQAPLISSQGGNPITFGEAEAGTFAFVAENFSGSPVFSLSQGTLPTGLTLVDLGTGTALIEGTPAIGDAAGSPYDVVISATDGISDVDLPITIDVNSGQEFTSATNDTFIAGTFSSFQVSTNIGGSPTYTISGNLPTGVTFDTSTGVLSGTAAEITGGVFTFPLTFGISGNNSITPQNFVLTIDESPQFTSGASATFLTNTAGTFAITTTGNPNASTLTETGQLPTGLSFVNNLNGTGEISGTPAAGISGTFDVVLTASNGIAPAATETLNITVSNSAPTITVANGTLTLINTPLTDTINFNVSGGQLQVSFEGETLSYQLGTITDIMVRLGAGNDSLSIGAGVPAVFAKCQTGQDTIVASNDAADTLIGGSGSDSINVSGTGADSLIGRAGSDTLVANGGNSTLKAGSGPSSLSGGNGNDLLIGNGSATLIAGSGNSTLIAGNGDSSLSGGSGQDSIMGGRGNDTLVGGTGNSTLISGSGSDSISGGSGDSSILSQGPGNSTIAAGSGNDTITAATGNVSVLGGSGSSLIQGGLGNDTLIAGGPGSTLLGGAGNDSIAGAGGDVLGGGTGSDTIAAFPTDTIMGSPTDLIIL
jgi:Ca2+-binding RTX toxin-like protein